MEFVEFIKVHKKLFILLAILASLTIVLAITLYMMFSTKLVITHYIIDFGGERMVRIVHLSDLHLKSFSGFERDVIDKVVELNPDIIVLTGDYVEDQDDLVFLEDFVKELHSRVGDKPVYAVIGNWELQASTEDRVRELFSKYGIILLVNNCTKVVVNNVSITVIGFDDYLWGSPDLSLLSNCSRNDLSIALVHEPSLALRIGEEGFYGVVFAGHCHGGQVKVFGAPLYLPRGCPPKLYEGFHKVNNTYIVVSRGLGSWSFTKRIGVDQEIVVVDIKV